MEQQEEAQSPAPVSSRPLSLMHWEEYIAFMAEEHARELAEEGCDLEGEPVEPW